ncbi:MAG: hypothetical protein ACRDK2_16565 [Solirubrobacteraceae bacterium]
MNSGHRRRFLLDSGAVTALARDPRLLADFTVVLDNRYDAAIRIPSPVMGEVRTDDPRYDVALNRLLKRIAGPDGPYASLRDEAANRAGGLRHQALKALGEDRDRTRDGKLTIDAFVVAIAEEISRTCAVTILTGDLEHIELLVRLTGARNISVRRAS